MQGAERNVRGLLGKLERLRAEGLDAASIMPHVIDIVSEINQERSSLMKGRHSYISSAYVWPTRFL